MNIPFSPPDITEEEIEAVAEVMRSGWITTGPKTKELERKMAEFTHTNRGVCLNSATSCMEMALRLFEIGPGDEVIVPAYTYTASASVVCHVGATLRLVDVEKGTFHIDYAAVESMINENTKAIPLISYEGDTFYVRQTTLGFILSQSEKNELSLTASWMPLEFDPADNDDYAMQQLDKRDSTAMAGVAWYHHERWGTVKASAAADVLDNSNGWVGELSVFHKMQIGRLSLTPALGVLYYDENFSDYYYGISESESRRSGLASYSAQDAWVPYVSLTAKYPIGEHVVLMASAGYSELPKEITDSPMIDRNESFTFVTGVSWRF